MGSSDNGDDHRGGYLQAFFEKPSGNPYARAQEPEGADVQPSQAAPGKRLTPRERPDKRRPSYQGEAACSRADRGGSLKAFFDKSSGNPYARAQTPDAAETELNNATRSQPSAQDAAISRDRLGLENPYAHLDGEGIFHAIPNERRPRSGTRLATMPAPLSIDPTELVRTRRQRKRYPKSEIEGAARALQTTLWHNRKTLFPERQISDPMELIDPSLAIKCLGMSFDVSDSLGQYSDSNGRFEVAGLIDPVSNQVRTSRQFLPYVQNFTAAHELGHAVLHGGTALHRDRAQDGSTRHGSQDWREIEANSFAAAFLMPAKQVRLQFRNRFHTTRLILDDDTAFGLASRNQDSLRASLREHRDWSRTIAAATYYQGQHFVSLAEQFNVSVGAMSIRIEELALIGL